jgi:hypothetical protein
LQELNKHIRGSGDLDKYPCNNISAPVKYLHPL